MLALVQRARNACANACAVLTCLRVRSFAIIEALEVELDAGLNIVTGETGAGKSILVDALQLVLGARGRPEVVRTDAAAAEVEVRTAREQLEVQKLFVEDSRKQLQEVHECQNGIVEP